MCAYHTVVFKTKISQFKNENAPTKDRNGKEFDLVFFTAENVACFGPPLCFLYSIVKESKLLKEKFIFWIYKGFIDFLYILTSAWKKNYKMFPDLKLILVTVNILITALITRNMKFMLAFKYLAEFFSAFLPQSFPQKESVFSFKLLNDALIFFPPCTNWWQRHRGTQRGYSSKPLNIALLNVF